VAAFRWPGSKGPDFAAAQVLADVLGTQRSSLQGTRSIASPKPAWNTPRQRSPRAEMAQHCSRLAFGTPRLDGWLVRAGDRISLTDDLHPIGKRAEIYRDDLDEMKAATAEFIAHHGIDAKGRKVPPAIATTSYTMSTTIFEPSPSSP
jgi:hypothetical protein